VKGYNSDTFNRTAWQNDWVFATRAPDSGKTVLDEKSGRIAVL